MTNKFINENFDKEIAEMKKVNSLLKEKGPTNNDKRLVVERNKFKTEVGKILYDLLIQISDDNLFLYDIFSSVKGDEKKLQLIEYLKENQRNKNEIEHVASLIDIGIYGLSSEEVYDKFNSSEISSKLFHIMRGIDTIAHNDDPSQVDYIRICRIMSLLETDEEREMLINTIIREIEKNEIPFKQFMSLIYLSVQNYYDKKYKK